MRGIRDTKEETLPPVQKKFSFNDILCIIVEGVDAVKRMHPFYWPCVVLLKAFCWDKKASTLSTLSTML